MCIHKFGPLVSKMWRSDKPFYRDIEAFCSLRLASESYCFAMAPATPKKVNLKERIMLSCCFVVSWFCRTLIISGVFGSYRVRKMFSVYVKHFPLYVFIERSDISHRLMHQAFDSVMQCVSTHVMCQCTHDSVSCHGMVLCVST